MKKKIAKNIRRSVLLLFSFIFFSLLSADSASALSCIVDSAANCAAAGKTTILKMSDTDNAHAEFVGESNYSNYICCSESTTGVIVNRSCDVDDHNLFLKLQQATNSHVEKESYSNYGRKACVGVSVGKIVCSYPTADCAGLFTCLARISADTNAHIGSCAGSSYATRVCCKYTILPVLSISANPSSIILGVTTNVTFTVTSGGLPISGAAVNFFVGGIGAGSCDNPTDINGKCIESMVSGGPNFDVVASKTGYDDGATMVTVTAVPVLSISADPSSITSSVSTSVKFTVTSGGAGVNGATVTLSGGASGSCTTANVSGTDGICSRIITATSPVTATASKMSYTNGTTTITIGVNACDTLNCNDSNPCTDDSCDYATQSCARTINTNTCDDGRICTHTDVCSNGSCNGTTYICNPSGCEATSVCNGAGGCNVTYYPPSCVSLTPAHQDSIRRGNITLTASTTCATDATIDNRFGAISVNGSETVAYDPPAGVYSTTYQMDLRGYGPSNDVSNACSAVGNPVVDLLPQCTLAANPTVVARGDESDFTWTTMDADSSKGYNIDHAVGDVSAASQPKAVLYINSPIDFTMTVEGFKAGNPTPHTNTCSVHIDELTSCDLISPTTPTTPIVAGNPANISWTSTNASGGTITPPGSPVLASGNMNVNPIVTTTYRLDVDGTHSDTNFCAATVHVIPSITPDCISLVADPSTLSLRNSLKLTWVTSGSISALIDNSIGYVTPTYGGDKFFYPTVVGAYPITMTVTSSSGATDTCSANITVTPAVINPKVELLKNAAGSIEQIASNILGWALSIAGSLLLLIIIIGGALYISSTGEENKITAAKKTITWAIIGAILILVAYTISSIVYGFFGL